MRKIFIIVISLCFSVSIVTAQNTAKDLDVLSIPDYFNTYMTEKAIKKIYQDKVSLFEGDLLNAGGWGPYYDLPSTVEFFAEENQLAQKSVKQISSKDNGADYDIFFERYWTEGFEEEVWLYRIEEGRHVWPGTKFKWWSNPIAWYYFGSGNEDINASEEVWAFFKKYL